MRRIDLAAISTWALVGGLVLYLAIDGGGYDIVVTSQVAIIVWWLVLLGATWGFLPVARTSRIGWAGLSLFGGLVAWTAIASTWSLSATDDQVSPTRTIPAPPDTARVIQVARVTAVLPDSEAKPVVNPMTACAAGAPVAASSITPRTASRRRMIMRRPSQAGTNPVGGD